MNDEAQTLELAAEQFLSDRRHLRLRLYQQLWDRLGSVRQLGVAVEELSELTKELSRAIEDEVKPEGAPPRTSTDKIIDEVTDVSIILEELIYHYDIEKEVHKLMGKKLRRTEKFLMSLDNGENK